MVRKREYDPEKYRAERPRLPTTPRPCLGPRQPAYDHWSQGPWDRSCPRCHHEIDRRVRCGREGAWMIARRYEAGRGGTRVIRKKLSGGAS